MAGERREHVILFPFMAQGHITPFSALALEIEKRGFDVTIVNTPLNIRNLRASLCPTPRPSIRFREIPFNSSDHGLPPDAENTDGLPPQSIHPFVEASLSLKPAFRELVAALLDEPTSPPPLCIISDFFFGWAAEVAREFDIFHSVFPANGAFGMAAYFSLWTTLPRWKADGASEFLNDDFPEGGKIHVTQLSPAMAAATRADPWSVYLGKRLLEWKESNGLLFNTVEEIDEVGLGYFRRRLGLPVYPIGPVLLKKELISTSSHECLEWLDTKPKNSVLYVCFGSQGTLAPTQTMRLATALEVSRRPFIWVVRAPQWRGSNPGFEAGDEWLPKGFEQRLEKEKMGLLVRKWAPQVEILSHKSVGGFISHCGWNSVLEAIGHGVPILGWPMMAEQFFNAKFLAEEAGVCIELGRGATCEVEQDDMVKKIEMIMGDGDEAVGMRERASQVRGIIEEARKDESGCKGSSVKALDEFFNAAMLWRSEKVGNNKGSLMQNAN